MASVQVLGENRYRCFGCGSCCFGHAIELLDADEARRIEQAGETLGVANPVEGSQVRFENHQCVFHGEDRLCRIHKELGSDVKPLRCQLWPLKLVVTDEGNRFGLDPGCLNTYRTWKDGDVQTPAARMVPQRAAVTSQENGSEGQLIAMTSVPNATVAGIATILSGGKDITAQELPEGMASRFVVRLQALRFGQLLAKPEFGAGIQEPLAHVPAAIDALDPLNPPSFAGLLSDNQHGFTLEVARRKLWLRQAPVTPASHGLLVLSLLGAVGCAWADPAPERYGPALSAWSRLMRFQAFWLRLAPDLEMLRWLMTGEYDGEFDPTIVLGQQPKGP